jgi:uncharacterized protein YbjT (DUF2867 family)
MVDREAIFVTGATGTVGQPIVSHLVRQGFDVWAATRVPGLVGGRMPAVLIDWDDASTYRPFLRSARTVVLVIPTMADQLDRASALISSAAELGIGHIIKLSTIGSGRLTSRIDMWHDAIDAHLRESSVLTTQIKVAPVMQGWLARRPWNGAYEGTSAHPLPYVDARDVAAFISSLIRTPANADFTVTGSVSHAPEAVAAIIADVMGAPVGYRRIHDTELWTRFTDAGVAPDVADLLVEHHRATDSLDLVAPTSDLSSRLGRRPLGFTDFVRDHRRVLARMLEPVEAH